MTEKLKAQSSQPKPQPYGVSFTAGAEAVYLSIEGRSRRAEEDGDPDNEHCKTFRIIDDTIRRLIPADPKNPKYGLYKPLDGLYRIAKGRLRIVWMPHPDEREVLIVYISETLRKEGDKSDPYAILNAMAEAGHLDSMIEDWLRAFEVPPDAPVN
jgi:hypothetical protein